MVVQRHPSRFALSLLLPVLVGCSPPQHSPVPSPPSAASLREPAGDETGLKLSLELVFNRGAEACSEEVLLHGNPLQVQSGPQPRPWEPATPTDWLMVKVRVEAGTSSDSVLVRDAAIVSADGTRFPSLVTARRLAPRELFYAFPVPVPRGEELAAFEIGETDLDLHSAPWRSSSDGESRPGA